MRKSRACAALGATRSTAVFGALDESYENGAGVAWVPSGALEGADLVLPSDLDENRSNCPSMPWKRTMPHEWKKRMARVWTPVFIMSQGA